MKEAWDIIKLKMIRWWNTTLNKMCINCSCRVYKDDFENSKCCDWSWRKR